jgi:hypothetical protein
MIKANPRMSIPMDLYRVYPSFRPASSFRIGGVSFPDHTQVHQDTLCGFAEEEPPKSMGDLQDPTDGGTLVPYVWPYFVGIFTYIGLKNRPYIW